MNSKSVRCVAKIEREFAIILRLLTITYILNKHIIEICHLDLGVNK